MVRLHITVQRPVRVSCRRRHAGLRNIKIAEEVSSRKEQIFTVFRWSVPACVHLIPPAFVL